VILAALLLQVAVVAAPLDPPSRLVLPRHDVLHYDITMQLSDTGTHILGQSDILVRLQSTAPIVLDLDRRYREVRIISQGHLPHGREDDTVIIPHQKEPGDTMTVRVRWHGEPAEGMLISTNRFGGRTIFADNYPDRARRWMPVQDHPSDKATVSWHIEVPPGYQGIGNGEFQKLDTLPYGRLIWNYRESHAVPTYVMVAGMAKFARQELAPAACAVKCVPQAVWSYPGDSAYAINGPFRRTTDMLDYFSGLIGPFPYERLTHVESTTQFGGMENASAIFYGDRLYESQRLSEETVAHETAHQWFGDAVTPADFTHVWLSEGFATYFAALWVGHADGPAAFRAAMQRAADQVRSSKATAQPILGPLPENLSEILSTNPYQKGAWTLHSLRYLVGDTAFFGGIRAYSAKWKDGNTRTADLRDEINAASGQQVDWFFQQALTQPGYPKLTISWTHDAAKRRLVLDVRQTQDAAWGLYRLPKLELQLGRTRARIDVAAAASQRIIISGVRTAPADLAVDPDGWWLLDATVMPSR